jgi:anti-sigma B factor antagonist
MSTVPAQIWKGSKFHIDRLPGQVVGAIVFRFSGPFTARDMYSALSPAALKDLFESDPETRHPSTKVIFDLTEVPYIDSCGLGLIVGQFVRSQNKGAQFIAAGVGPRVLELLKMTKVDSLFPITGTVEEAFSLAHPGPAN